jgi:hypothetical protein
LGVHSAQSSFGPRNDMFGSNSKVWSGEESRRSGILCVSNYSGRMDLLSFSTSWENGQWEGLERNQTAAGYRIRIRGSYAFG